MVTEWVQVKTTLFAIDNKEFQCSSCLHKYDGRADAEQMTSRSREAKACQTKREKAFVDVEQKIFFHSCPGNYVFPEVLSWIEDYQLYQKGILPFPGSVSDQPAKVIELFQILDQHYLAKALAEKKRVEAAQRQKESRRG